jgi:hypothetical protein
VDLLGLDHLACGGGERHGQRPQHQDFALRIGRAQALGAVQLVEHAAGDGGARLLEALAAEPVGQAGGGTGEGGDLLADVGVHLGQHLHLGAGRHSGQRGEAAPEVEVGADQVVEAGAGGEDFGKRLGGHLQRQGASRPGRGRLLHDVEQGVDLVAPGAGVADGGGDAAAELVGGVGIAQQALGGRAVLLVLQVGEGALAPVLEQPFDGALREACEHPHHLVHGLAAAVGFGTRSSGPRGAGPTPKPRALDQVGAVQQLEGGGGAAVQPVVEQAADTLARVPGVEVVGGDAERPAVDRRLVLDLRGGAAGHDGGAQVLAGGFVQHLAGDADRRGPARLHELLGGGHRLGALRRRQLQRPAGVRFLPYEELVVDGVGQSGP